MNSMPTEQTARLSRGSRSSRFNRRILHKNGVIKKINCVITLSSKPFLRPQWAVGGDKMLYRMPYLGHVCEGRSHHAQLSEVRATMMKLSPQLSCFQLRAKVHICHHVQPTQNLSTGIPHRRRRQSPSNHPPIC